MRVTVVLLTLLLIGAALSAQTPKIGIGGFAGLSIPLAQDDQASGKEEHDPAHRLSRAPAFGEHDRAQQRQAESGAEQAGRQPERERPTGQCECRHRTTP